MKKKIFLLPLSLFAIFALVTWSCEKDESDDVCDKYQPAERCEIANACCPTDGGNCYYEYNDQKYYCDKTQDSEDNPDGCNDAMEQVLNAVCGSAKGVNYTLAKAELRALTQQLLNQARVESLCN